MNTSRRDEEHIFVLIGKAIALNKGLVNIRQDLEVFQLSQFAEGGSANGNQWVEARDSAIYLTIHRTDPHSKNYLVQMLISSAEVEKLGGLGKMSCFLYLIK